MVRISALDRISLTKGFGTAAEHPATPWRFLGRQHIDGQSLVSSKLSVIRLLSGTRRMFVPMALHSKLGENSGQRKPILDLLGHQDITDSASFYESMELSHVSLNYGQGMAIVGAKIIRSVPRLN